MIYENFNDFPRTGRILCIDWGAKRTGVAVSDPERDFVFPREQITDNRAQSAILEIIASERIVGIIIGLPLRADGSDSATTTAVREFAAALAAVTEIPIAFMNESLTSVAADEILGNTNMRKRKQNKSKLDSVAASVILENAIEMIKRNT